jgi:hypothetical protein
MPQWAGLGGVRFVPDDEEAEMSEQRKIELNHLNQRLVDTLRSTDAAFSMGEPSKFCTNLYCLGGGRLSVTYLIIKLKFQVALFYIKV